MAKTGGCSAVAFCTFSSFVNVMKPSEPLMVSCLICNPKNVFVDFNCLMKVQLLYRVGYLFLGGHAT